MREPFCKARAYITSLLVIEILLGAAIILITAIYHRILGSFLADIERKMLDGQFFNTYIIGFQLIVTYTGSFPMWTRVWNRRFTSNIHLLLSVWMFFCFLIVFCGFGSIWSLFACSTAMENTAEMTLLKGIDLYYTCPEWKLLWDGLQFHRECCGVHGHRDWMRASWMPPDSFDSDQCSTEKKTTLAPYACCKHSCNSCFENYIPRSGNIPYLNLTQINTNGCLPLFKKSMWTVLYMLLVLVLIACLVDILICSLTKYIIRKQCSDDNSRSNLCMTDDQGRPLIYLRCPPTVCCVMENDEDAASDACHIGEVASYESACEPKPHSCSSKPTCSKKSRNCSNKMPPCQCCSKPSHARFLH